jgi:hypothetical protein
MRGMYDVILAEAVYVQVLEDMGKGYSSRGRKFLDIIAVPVKPFIYFLTQPLFLPLWEGHIRFHFSFSSIFSFSFFSASASSKFVIMWGVMKISRLVLVVLSESVLNKRPSRGISPKKGTF